jgi:polysaccharide deacetylase family protein (PEP-CTERM system associated)
VSASAPRTIRNAMTVDVEDYFHVSAFAETIRRGDWNTMEYRAESNTAKLLDLFAAYDVVATFFVLGWVARRSPKLVREIHAAGHEIACHGMTHELVYRQKPDDFARETREAKHLLEDIVGAAVGGYRAASWSVTRASLWALDIIKDAGFRYDSSIFPVRHDRYGIPGASQRPAIVKTPAGREIIEFPPSTVSLFGLRLPVAGGGYFRILPYAVTRAGLRHLNRDLHQPFIFYLHPWEVDVSQPRVRAGALSRFRHYTNIHRTEPRLRRLLDEFRCTSVRNVLADIGLLETTDRRSAPAEMLTLERPSEA